MLRRRSASVELAGFGVRKGWARAKNCRDGSKTVAPFTRGGSSDQVSEALALRWEDVDFEAKEVRVCWQLDEKGALKKPKTKAGLRTVPLLPILDRPLREHRNVQLAVGLF